MKKTIILDENAFNKIKRAIIKEAIKPAPIFGRRENFAGPLAQLAKVSNLRVDRYKDYKLEQAFEDWKNVGFDKNTEEYYIYNAEFQHFMFGDGGLLAHISYTSERTTYINKKTGKKESLPLHKVILDTDWADGIIRDKQTQNWKYSQTNSNAGSFDKQCFYTTILKIFQNPVIWNDFFFNPFFADAKKKYDDIRIKISAALKSDKDSYTAILPYEEFKELNMFMFEVNKDTMKVEKGINCKPELFYDPNFGASNGKDDFDEEF